LDELGEGAATKVFVAGVGHDLQNTISLRSAGARIQRRDDTLYVALPREHVLVVFSRGRIRSAASVGAGTPTGKSLLPWARTEVTTIDDLTMLAEYSGKLRMNLPLDDAQQGSFGPGLEAVFAAGQTPQNQPGPTDGGSGGGCAASCTVSCRDGGACNVSCPTHQCAMCTCVGGTSCYCF
jgi:hypothetical protein